LLEILFLTPFLLKGLLGLFLFYFLLINPFCRILIILTLPILRVWRLSWEFDAKWIYLVFSFCCLSSFWTQEWEINLFKFHLSSWVLLLTLNCLKCLGRKIKTKCTSKSLNNSNFSAFNFDTRWDISLMYSLMFHLPLYLIEISLASKLLAIAFSLLVKYCSITSRKSLALWFSEIESRKTYVENIRVNRKNLGRAGSKCWIGKRPIVRGIVMNPVNHPYGDGEGRAPIGSKKPVTPWSFLALGRRSRRRKKYNEFMIIKQIQFECSHFSTLSSYVFSGLLGQKCKIKIHAAKNNLNYFLPNLKVCPIKHVYTINLRINSVK